ncbi:probable LRR receptor-like serine/threonine-protein kinase At3g47570 [Morus notabilis]|uniref:probable LRR receptor-like serine/threonine-protein kinase At3g47570 n=1 Tax=Morus notabilis TaxID=981085 RepID=UPI000CED7F03|nr:probable LRR receptor-like serine/threonine-protein kinase At3g47570 [Morus notabilis]
MDRTYGNSLSIYWFLLLQALLISSVSISGGDDDRDKLSLVAFKSEIEDPLNIMSSWNASQHFCKWQGVTCGRRHRRVTSLVLESCQLNGQLSSHIGNLSFLRTLNLQNNSFIREIPPEISNLFRLKTLALGNNSFSGKVPTNLSHCSNLEYLDLSFNNLTAKVPQDISFLSKLRVLLLNDNKLFGEIPASLGNLSLVMKIHLGDNSFHGEIPHSFGQLKSLIGLALYRNNLKGTIPPSIYNISSLQIIMFQTNQLEGTLPSDLGNSIPNIQVLMLHANRLQGTLSRDFGNYLPNLQVLTLATNYLIGPIPVTISNMSQVTIIEISSNFFTGEVPSLASLPKLQILGISDNNLGHGKDDDLKFLSSLVNCTDLQVLGIENNSLRGVMPESISNFSTRLRDMIFGSNQISGSIPTGIGLRLVNLMRLGLENNELTGIIPSSIGKMQKLYALALGRNKLSSHIPSSLGNLTSLSTFDLTLNNIDGMIPSSLGQCRQLLYLRLSKNNLSGPIPKQLISLSSLIFIDLGTNHFTGSIPMEMGQLINIVYFDVSENKLVGKIPETIGGCTLLRNLHLQGNSLQGTIPRSLSYLRGLDEIDLSRNNLSGEIPTYFGGFRFLKILNLSFNNLEGQVPVEGSIFKNLSGFSAMGNYRLCGGVLELHLPRCPADGPKKHKRSPPQKLIISIIACGLGLIFLMFTLLSLYLSRKRKTMSTSAQSNTMSSLQLSYGDLVKATNDFSPANLIGAGSFGSVYKGILTPDETVVAVKVLNLQTSRASKSFIAECKALRNIRHRNLVKVLTACSSTDFQGNDFKALVYEYMVNGSLEEWLHDEERHLSLIQRVNVAIDVASALDYLHNFCDTAIVHCDLKPSNVLLDKDLTAHVGDFGLVRFISDPSHPFSSNHSSSVDVRGSIGYAAPEYGIGSEVSTSGDVYSYGILLLEMFTGKRSTDGMFEDDLNLHNFALMALPEHLEEILDPRLLEPEDERIKNSLSYNNQIQNQMIRKCLISVIEVGVACSAELPGDRMSIDNAVSELSHIRGMLLKTRMQTNDHIINTI